MLGTFTRFSKGMIKSRTEAPRMVRGSRKSTLAVRGRGACAHAHARSLRVYEGASIVAVYGTIHSLRAVWEITTGHGGTQVSNRLGRARPVCTPAGACHSATREVRSAHRVRRSRANGRGEWRATTTQSTSGSLRFILLGSRPKSGRGRLRATCRYPGPSGGGAPRWGPLTRPGRDQPAGRKLARGGECAFAVKSRSGSESRLGPRPPARSPGRPGPGRAGWHPQAC